MAGGYSRRMGRDKALLDYHGIPQARWTAELLGSVCDKVWISCREGQETGTGDQWDQIYDQRKDQGPVEGFLSAHAERPDAAWLVVACDLPNLTREILTGLLEARDPACLATAYRAARDGLPEPLCALYEPEIMPIFRSDLAAGRGCPRKTLLIREAQVNLIDLPRTDALDNINTPEELCRLTSP
jgi:molybdopterin-guanine dinucleotide biosynthesis protein A